MSAPAPAKYFRPGQFIFNENDPSHSIFLVKKGTISIRKRKAAAFVEIARVYSNEVIGELSFFDRQPRSAGAMALTEVEVLEIRFEALDKIFKNVPDYFKTIVVAMAERLRKADDIIRRLEKNVVNDNDGTQKPEQPNESAADILAATADALNPDAKPGEDPEPKG